MCKIGLVVYKEGNELIRNNNAVELDAWQPELVQPLNQ